MKNLISYLMLFCLCLLAACEGPAPKDTQGLRNIIPTAELDRAPANPKDVSNVKDAVPRLEPRTAAGNKSPYMVKGIIYRVMNDPTGYEAMGKASWYGEKFHGNRTSNGEIYDMYEMTAAHKTLPIPSYVKVTNVENGKSIVVRVNDRGPFAPGRIIDLSYAGAKKLDFIEAGTAHVKVEYINPLTYTATQKPASPSPLKLDTSDHHLASSSTKRGSVSAPSDVTSIAKTSPSSLPTLPADKPKELSSAATHSNVKINASEKVSAVKPGYDAANSGAPVTVPASTSSRPELTSAPVQFSNAGSDKADLAKATETPTPQKILSDWRAPQRYLQVGAYKQEPTAIAMKSKVETQTNWPLFIEKGEHVDGYEIYRVHIGPLPDESSLLTLKKSLMDKGLDEPLRVLR